jgi:transcriptional regulator with XRE-family HTH domain
MAASNDHAGRRARSRAAHIHPVVRSVFEEMDRRNLTYKEMEKLSGVSNVIMWYWNAGRSNPNILNISYTAEALGYRIVLEKIEDDRPTET